MKRSTPLAIALVVLALVFAGVAVFYWTTPTSLLAGGDPVIHHKHAAVAAVLALVSLVGASFARPRPAG